MSNGTDRGDVIWKENHAGVEKPFVRVDIGTTVVETPARLTNPITQRTHDLRKLRDDGYLKVFLALKYAANSPDVVDFGSTPVATFDKDRWEMEEKDSQYVLVKRDAETKFEEKVLGNNNSVAPGGDRHD
jgi:hypothetical protein